MQTPLRELQHPVDVQLPSLRAVLRNGNDGRPLNLTEFASVKFRMISADGVTTKINDAAAVFDDQAAGLVRYDWTLSNVDTLGRYHCWFLLTDGTGREELFPVGEKLIVEFV